MPDPLHAPRSAVEALELCRRHSTAGTYVVSEAAHERLKTQGLSQGDVLNVLASASSCTLVVGRRWTIHGSSLDGAPMSVLVAFDDGAVTVL